MFSFCNSRSWDCFLIKTRRLFILFVVYFHFRVFLNLFLGTPFPKTFMQVAKKILSRLFRVFVHVYIHHFDRVSQMGAEAHVNTCYKHFYNFVTEFNLIDHKELEPLVSICVKENNSQKALFFYLQQNEYIILNSFYITLYLH